MPDEYGTFAEIGRLWVELSDEQTVAQLRYGAKSCKREARAYEGQGATEQADKARADAETFGRLAELIAQERDETDAE